MLNYVVGWQSRSFLTGLLQYLAKNMALLVAGHLKKNFFCGFLNKCAYFGLTLNPFWHVSELVLAKNRIQVLYLERREVLKFYRLNTLDFSHGIQEYLFHKEVFLLVKNGSHGKFDPPPNTIRVK